MVFRKEYDGDEVPFSSQSLITSYLGYVISLLTSIIFLYSSSVLQFIIPLYATTAVFLKLNTVVSYLVVHKKSSELLKFSVNIGYLHEKKIKWEHCFLFLKYFQPFNSTWKAWVCPFIKCLENLGQNIGHLEISFKIIFSEPDSCTGTNHARDVEGLECVPRCLAPYRSQNLTLWLSERGLCLTQSTCGYFRKLILILI